MVRAKVHPDFVQNTRARKATLKKRKAGLIKKVHELSTLCGVDACAIIYNPDCSVPDVWPSRLGVQKVVDRFNYLPAYDKMQNMENQEKLAKQQLSKAYDQLKKIQMENSLKELNLIWNNMDKCKTKEWMQSQNTDYLVYLNNYVFKPQIKELEKKEGNPEQEPNGSSEE